MPWPTLYRPMGHDHSSREIQSQDHKSRIRVMVRKVRKDGNTVGLALILNRGQFVFQLIDSSDHSHK